MAPVEARCRCYGRQPPVRVLETIFRAPVFADLDVFEAVGLNAVEHDDDLDEAAVALVQGWSARPHAAAQGACRWSR